MCRSYVRTAIGFRLLLFGMGSATHIASRIRNYSSKLELMALDFGIGTFASTPIIYIYIYMLYIDKRITYLSSLFVQAMKLDSKKAFQMHHKGLKAINLIKMYVLNGGTAGCSLQSH